MVPICYCVVSDAAFRVTGEQFRTAVYQLCQRELTSILQQAHIQVGTTGVRQGEDPVAKYRIQRKRIMFYFIITLSVVRAVSSPR